MVQDFVARKYDNSALKGRMGINGMKKWNVLSRVINGRILKLDDDGDVLYVVEIRFFDVNNSEEKNVKSIIRGIVNCKEHICKIV